MSHKVLLEKLNKKWHIYTVSKAGYIQDVSKGYWMLKNAQSDAQKLARRIKAKYVGTNEK